MGDWSRGNGDRLSESVTEQEKNIMNNLEINKVITLSTAHIMPDTADFLDKNVMEKSVNRTDDYDIIVYQKAAYGWIIIIADDTKESMEQWPKDLQDVIQFALEQECYWICLDCDGDITGELKTYNWN